jgi:hypothetical protein
MKNRPSQASRDARQRPLDHLRRGEQQPPTDHPEAVPPTPDSDREATQGKHTRSPDTVATRDHLEGSEQGPA